MKGFYSRDKRKQFEDRLKQEQEKFEQDLKKAKAQKTKLTVGIDELREHSKVIEAQKRLKELQKQEKERLKLKDNRDYYLNFLRNQRFSKQDSGSNNLHALDLGFNPQSRIPKPSLMKKAEVQVTDESKIPKFKNPLNQIPEKSENLPWKKGDLLDSLDLSSTNLKKMFQNRPKLCESPGREKGKDPEWLKENFRESINEWAPKKIEPLPEIKPTKRVLPRNVNKVGFADKIGELKEMNKVEKHVKNVKFLEEKSEKVNKRYERPNFEEENETREGEKIQEVKKNREDGKIEQKKVDEKLNVKKQSRFVNKIKAIPEAKDDFLECELHCVNDEEARLEASLARLDFKSLRLKHQAELAQIELQAKQLEESINRSNFKSELDEVQKELKEKYSEVNNNEEKYSEKGKKDEKNLEIKKNKANEENSDGPENYENEDFEIEEIKIEAKKVVTRKISPGVESSTNITSQIPDNASVFSAHPYPRQRPSPDSRSVVSEYPERPRNCYSKKEVHRIGAVYNEIAARSGRYGKKNPPPEYALPKNKSKEMISFRKPPPGPEYTTEVIKVNPNVDIKSLFQD